MNWCHRSLVLVSVPGLRSLPVRAARRAAAPSALSAAGGSGASRHVTRRGCNLTAGRTGRSPTDRYLGNTDVRRDMSVTVTTETTGEAQRTTNEQQEGFKLRVSGDIWTFPSNIIIYNRPIKGQTSSQMPFDLLMTLIYSKQISACLSDVSKRINCSATSRTKRCLNGLQSLSGSHCSLEMKSIYKQ